MSLTRRKFLAAGAGSAAVIASTARVPGFLMDAAAASAQGSGDNVLIVVQLSGGNDGLNTVIPYADDDYQKHRFATRISDDLALKIDDYLGLHPSMTGFSELFEDGRLAVVQGVGYPNPNRSHFESMDIWHTAMHDNGARQTGWLGRYLDASQARSSQDDVPAVHFGSRAQPLALAGLRVHVPTIDSLDGFQLQGASDDALSEAIQRATDAPRQDAHEITAYLQAAAQAALSASRQVQHAVAQYDTPVQYPPTPLARRLRSVAQLIEAGMSTRIYYVTLDGFDTHSEQAGAHAALLQELSDAVAAFLKDVEHHGQHKRIALLAFSEFGRRVKENASRGTDHGAAAPVFIAGGAVAGGLVGEHPSLTDLDDGDLKFHTDFRHIYATLIEEWLGASSTDAMTRRFDKLPLFT